MKIAPDITLATEFLSNWKPAGPWPLCAFHEDKTNSFATFGPGKLDEMAEWITEQQVARRNIYFHVNTVHPDGKASKGQVTSIDWLHVDVDPKKGEDLLTEQKRILAKLQAKDPALPPAHVIIFSGGGYQAFWHLDEPIQVNGDQSAIEDAEQYSVQIARLLGGDGCHNADRIMRLPGTINFPNAKKRDRGQEPIVAQLIKGDWDGRYPLDKFVKAPTRNTGSLPGSPNQVTVNVSGNVQRIAWDALEVDPVLSKIEGRAKVAIVHGRDPEQPLNGGNSRSDWVWHVACAMVRAGVDDDTMYAILTDPDLGISEHIRAQGNAAAQHRAAMRTIQRAREFAIEPHLELLNREYAVIESVGSKFRIACERYSHAKQRNEVEFLQVDGFLRMWGNKFVEMTKFDQNGQPVGIIQIPVGKWWMTHEHRREYREVTFFPNRDIPGAMNLWRGYGCDAVPGDCSLFLEHVRKVLCKGNETYYKYMVGWMANAVQNPHLPGQVAIVMRGGQGTGKGTFGKLLGKLFGAHYKYVSNPKHVTGQFNFMLHDAVLVFADECFAANDKAAESALKSLITEETIRVEPKGVDNLEARNCVHLIMATNHDWAISADLDDRRFFVLEVDDVHRTDTKYFGAMRAQMENGGYEALLHFLMTYDLSDFDVFNCPKTAELRKQQDHSMDDLSAFWLHALEEGRLLPSHSAWRRSVLKEALVEQFKAEHPKFPKNAHRALGIFLAKFGARSDTSGKPETWVDPTGRKRESSARPKIWTFPDLPGCRKLWEDVTKSGPREWPPIEDDTPEPPDDGGDAF